MHHPTDRIAHTTVVEQWVEREIAQWVNHEGSIRRPIAPGANALTTFKIEFVLDVPIDKVFFLSHRNISDSDTKHSIFDVLEKHGKSHTSPHCSAIRKRYSWTFNVYHHFIHLF